MSTQDIMGDINGGIVDWKTIYARLDEEFRCDHPTTEVRRIVFSNGAAHFKPQCLRCGEGLQCVSKASLTPEVIRKATDFDEALRDSWKARRDAARDALWSEWMKARPGRQRRYREDYLQSPGWRDRRRLVMERARGLCEGCRRNPATDVHHLRYDHCGNEFLFELVAICRDCHERLHAEEQDSDVESDDTELPPDEFDDGFR